MNSMMKKAAITGAAAAAAIGLGMGPAAAATVTVAGGPNFTASSVGSVTLSAGVSMSCTSASASGSVVPGSYTTTATVGHITSTTWNSCTALGAPSFPSQTGTWNLDATGAVSGGKAPGQISNVNATVSIPAVGCTLTVTGSAGGNYDNSAHNLNLTGTPTLSVARSGFCLGVTGTGSFTATYHVVGSPTDPITIS